MQTRKFKVEDTLPQGERILAHIPFYRDTKKAESANSVAGIFISEYIDCDDLISGIYGYTAKMSAVMEMDEGRNDKYKGMAVSTLCVKLTNTDNTDINDLSIIEIDKLTPSAAYQLMQLLTDWLKTTGRTFNNEDTLDQLICKNKQFVRYAFSRLSKLVVFKHLSYTRNLPKPTCNVVTIHLNRNADISAHGPLGTLTHTYVYL